MTDARAILAKKRDGGALTGGESRAFLEGYVAGEIPESFAAALLMAIFLRGMERGELRDWTAAMIGSGERWDWSELRAPTADKHSTGGIGDKVSIPLAPAVAACGVLVPMISGRGLGHTGGTLDKLEAIPGFRTGLTREDVRRCLERNGLAFGAQTQELVPADRQLYALRDVTGLIESLPLIASSILSKKIAEGARALVLDVKFGSGAFLPEPERGAELARTMIELAEASGVRAVAYQTAMDRPLGLAAGNGVEIAESLACLEGKGPPDLRELVVLLGGEMLVQAGVERELERARARIARALDDGSALERFRRAVEGQGGDVRALERPRELYARELVHVEAERAGHLAWRDLRQIGLALLELGGGRRRVEDAVDPRAGILFLERAGARLERGQPVLALAVTDRRKLAPALARARAAFEVSDAPPAPAPLVLARLAAPGLERAPPRTASG
jgi:pyrimidine-nucleoside phosphorylase